MIRIKVRRNRSKRIRSILVTGHAEYDAAGYDVVCAAVSALVQTIPLAFDKVLGLDMIYLREKGRFWAFLPQLDEEELVLLQAEAIFQAMLVGLRNMEASYQDFIEIKEEEGV